MGIGPHGIRQFLTSSRSPQDAKKPVDCVPVPYFRGETLFRAKTADILALAALLFLMALLVLWPLGASTWLALRDALFATPSHPSDAFTQSGLTRVLPLFFKSLLWSGSIGMFAAALAWPCSFSLAFGPARRWVWTVLPLALPGYLAFAGWGLLRAPGTPLGNAIETASQNVGPWIAVLVNRALAIAGLALWVSPLAAAVQAAVLRGIDPSVLESLRLETGGVRGFVARLRAGRNAFLASIGVTSALMLGSAVPLHLAEIRTSAIQVWLALDTTGPKEHWRVWAAAWPLPVTALVAGWWIGGAATGEDGPRGEPGPQNIAGARLWAVVLLVLAVIAPMLLFAWGLRDHSVFLRFPKLAAEAFATSGPAAAVVCAVGFAISVLAAWGLSTPGKLNATTRLVVRLFIFTGLLPGVMVGSAVSRSWAVVGSDGVGRTVSDSFLIIAFAHLARFAFLPVLVAAAAVRAEPASQRATRAIDGAAGFGAWCRSALPTHLPWLLLASVVAGLMSLQEIESAVLVQPPGETLARMILGFLHYSRTDELCASGLWLGGASLAIGALIRFGGRMGRNSA